LKLWKQGYASRIRLNCVKAAPMFDKKLYVEKWLKVIKPESSDFEAKDFSNVNVDKTVGLHAKSSKS
jgi:hypothetical protein